MQTNKQQKGADETAPLLSSAKAEKGFFYSINAGVDRRAVQELLGHADVATTMIYTHVLKVGGRGVHSPMDSLPAV